MAQLAWSVVRGVAAGAADVAGFAAETTGTETAEIRKRVIAKMVAIVVLETFVIFSIIEQLSTIYGFSRDNGVVNSCGSQVNNPNSCFWGLAAALLGGKKHAVLPQFEEKANAKGVKVLLNIHLDPAHKALMLFEAPSAEVVRDLVYEGGFVQFTDMEFYMVTPVPELIAKAQNFPTVF